MAQNSNQQAHKKFGNSTDRKRRAGWVFRSTAALMVWAMLLPIALPVPARAFREPSAEELFARKMFDSPLDSSNRGNGVVNSIETLKNLFGASDLAAIGTGAEESANLESGTVAEGASESDKLVAAAARRAELLARVNRLEASPSGAQMLPVGGVIQLKAIPVDNAGSAVHGLIAAWRTSDERVARISADQQLVAVVPGTAQIRAIIGKIEHSFTVTVTAATEKVSNTNQKTAEIVVVPAAVSLKNTKVSMPTAATLRRALTNEIPLPGDEVESVYSPENNLGSPPGQSELDSSNSAAATGIKHRAGAANFSFGVPFASLPGRGIDAGVGMTYNSRTWNKSWTADPANPGGGAIPHFTYDVDQSWIAPGFTAGLGELTSYKFTRSVVMMNGSNTVNRDYQEIVPTDLTDADGTRHQIECKTFGQIIGGHSSATYCKEYETADGSFIKIKGSVGRILGSQLNYDTVSFSAIYADGSKVAFNSPADGGGTTRQHFPVLIEDRNGNRLRVAYKNASGKIDYILDTLNRYIRFHYETDGDQRLVAVTVPGFDGGADRQTIRFYYAAMPLDVTGKLSGQITAPANITVLKYVYFPGTNSGYKYDYHPAFGMIKKISQMRSLEASTPSLTETGVITEGLWAATTEYTYPLGSTATPLDDVPKYSERIDDWQGRTAATAAVTQYHYPEPAPGAERITEIRVPQGNDRFLISRTVAHNYALDFKNGMIKETVVKNNLNQVFSRTVYEWAEGSAPLGRRRNPVLRSVVTTNEVNLTQKTKFEYDAYNNQTAAEVYDFNVVGGTPTEVLLRRTETVYENGGGWIGANLLRLPVLIKTIAADGTTVVSKTKIEYDNNGVENNVRRDDIDINTHNAFYNPLYPRSCSQICPGDTSYQGTIAGIEAEGGQVPPGSCVNQCSGSYTTGSVYRGNPTKVTNFANAALETDPDASVSAMRYDITGNMVEATLNCCQLKKWEYVKANEYAYPVETTSGAGGELVTKAGYDRHTGRVKTTTDENNQITSYVYDPNNLRLTRTDYPNGGWTAAEVHDELVDGANSKKLSLVKTTTKIEANKEVSAWQFLDGRGATVRTFGAPVNGVYQGVQDTEYDNLGRVYRSSNPYTAANFTAAINPANYWTTPTYDDLGRAVAVTNPDGTTAQNVPAEAAATVMYPGGASIRGVASWAADAAGKRRRQIVDALGRTVRVDEPTAGVAENNGLGTIAAPAQPTFYEYDFNDNLAKVIQNGDGAMQERIFKYDSLSRLTHERQPEMTATLSDAGTKLTTGGTWTGVYKYNQFGKLEWGADARGVKTTLSYDPLNRAKTVVYTGETNYQTPQVTYTYDEARAGMFNKGRLTKIETAASGQITPATMMTLDYDQTGQAVKQTQTTGGHSYDLSYVYNLAGQLTKQTYPSGKTVDYETDAVGRLATVRDANRTYISGLQYNQTNGALSSYNLGNGVRENFSFNAQTLQMSSQSVTKGAEVLQKFDYAYGQIDLATGAVDTSKNNGQLARIDGFIGGTAQNPAKQWQQRFAYDEVGRLSETREQRGDTNNLSYKQKFDYDRFGNQFRKAASNPIAGQETPLGFTPIEDGDINKSTNRFTANTGTIYDEAGSVKKDTKFRNFDYAYDANNRMIAAKRNDIINAVEANSVYDAAGQRVATKIGEIWTTFVYDVFGQKVAEYGGASAANNQSSVSYLHTDWQGSTRATTDASGAVTARFDYTAYGEDVGANVGMRTAGQGFSSSSNVRNRYALTERDEATNLDHAVWRKNDSKAGRWTSPDPYKGSMNLGNPQSFNRYTYTNNDPINLVDPSGLNVVAPANGTSCALQNSDGTTSPGTIYNGKCVIGATVTVGGSSGPIFPIGWGMGGGIITPRNIVDIGGSGGVSFVKVNNRDEDWEGYKKCTADNFELLKAAIWTSINTFLDKELKLWFTEGDRDKIGLAIFGIVVGIVGKSVTTLAGSLATLAVYSKTAIRNRLEFYRDLGSDYLNSRKRQKLCVKWYLDEPNKSIVV